MYVYIYMFISYLYVYSGIRGRTTATWHVKIASSHYLSTPITRLPKSDLQSWACPQMQRTSFFLAPTVSGERQLQKRYHTHTRAHTRKHTHAHANTCRGRKMRATDTMHTDMCACCVLRVQIRAHERASSQ